MVAGRILKFWQPQYYYQILNFFSMKKLLFLLAGLVLSIGVYSQDDADTAWKVSGDVSLMVNQSSFTNWAPGGDNNLNLTGFFNGYAGYYKNKTKWETILGLAYGQTKTGKQDFRKNEDKIDLQSTLGIEATEKWFYTLNFNFKSQFAKGYDYHDDVDTLDPVKISNFLAPGYTSLGIGMEYRPKTFMSLYISPITARWIFVNDQDLADVGSFGVEPAYIDDQGNFVPGEKSRFEFGAYFRFLFVKDIAKNVNLNTKLELFSDYTRKPGNIDVNWDTQINLKVNDWLSAMFGLAMVYDHDTPIVDKDGNEGPRLQIKEVLSVGLTYRFKNSE